MQFKFPPYTYVGYVMKAILLLLTLLFRMTRQKIGLSGWVTLSICMYNSQQTSSQNGTPSTSLERKWRQSTNYQSDKYWKTASSLFKTTSYLFISKKAARKSKCISGVTKTIAPLSIEEFNIQFMHVRERISTVPINCPVHRLHLRHCHTLCLSECQQCNSAIYGSLLKQLAFCVTLTF